MQIFSRELLGSRLDIKLLPKENFEKAVIEKCFERIFLFEQKYSRFQKNNWLYHLNHRKKAYLDSESRALIMLAQKISLLTEGYFDISVLPFLENNGYGIEEQPLSENYGFKNIELTEKEIILHNDIFIEFGALGKGYALELACKYLEPYCEILILNFGGDIKIKGKETILLEDPIHMGKFLGEIELENRALAASSGSKRKIQKGDHLISLGNLQEREIIGTFVSHQSGLFADIFSTALIVSPLEISLKIMKETPGLQAAIITNNGKIHQSTDFNILWNK